MLTQSSPHGKCHRCGMEEGRVGVVELKQAPRPERRLQSALRCPRPRASCRSTERWQDRIMMGPQTILSRRHSVGPLPRPPLLALKPHVHRSWLFLIFFFGFAREPGEPARPWPASSSKRAGRQRLARSVWTAAYSAAFHRCCRRELTKPNRNLSCAEGHSCAQARAYRALSRRSADLPTAAFPRAVFVWTSLRPGPRGRGPLPRLACSSGLCP